MKKLSLSLLALTFLFTLPASAQTFADQQNLLNLGERAGSNSGALIYTRAGSYYGVEGTPYLNETWVIGTIISMDGRKHEKTPLLYNAHYDLVEAVVGKDTLIVDSRLISRVEMPMTDDNGMTRLVVLKNGFSSSKEKIETTNFFEVLFEGDEFTIMRKHFKHLKKSDFDPAYNIGSKFDKFEYQGTLYIKKPDGAIEKLRNNKRGVLGYMGKNSKAVEDFINKENLKYNDDEHLGRIFSYYESLQ